MTRGRFFSLFLLKETSERHRHGEKRFSVGVLVNRPIVGEAPPQEKFVNAMVQSTTMSNQLTKFCETNLVRGNGCAFLGCRPSSITLNRAQGTSSTMMQGAFRLEGTAETSAAVDVGVCAASSFTERSFFFSGREIAGMHAERI